MASTGHASTIVEEPLVCASGITHYMVYKRKNVKGELEDIASSAKNKAASAKKEDIFHKSPFH